MENSYVTWLRSKVGTQKVFLPFASTVVRDEHGRILLQRRTDFDAWGLPGGVLELDEDLETCTRRELFEETGLTVGRLRLVGVYTDPRYDVTYPNGDQVQQCTICFEGTVNGGQMQPDGIETSHQEFVEPADLARYPVALWYRDMIADAITGGPPAFRAPFTYSETIDQIKSVRRFIGKDLYSGIAATAVVMREDVRILMLQHYGETAWRLPAGFSNLGENVAQTAVREVWEETGLHIKPDRILAVYASPKLNVTYPNGDQIRIVSTAFLATSANSTMTLDAKEVNAAQWMTAQEILTHGQHSRRWFYQRLLRHVHDGYLVC